ncbi:MAG: hypothetical protein RLO52_07655, partial [Sandaracinaceae bacterium]
MRPVVDLAAAHAPEAAAEEPSCDGPEEIVAVGHAFELRHPFVVRATDPETVRRDPGAHPEPRGPRRLRRARDRNAARPITHPRQRARAVPAA